ncbi:MAG TPA: hypothetical protein VKV03_05485 [Candidatus Binataceae bacterium]|nr:hypothetical protein [Candidatus Binataceae bacterium]
MRKVTSAIIAIAIAAGLAVPAIAGTPAPRAFNVTFDGYYLITDNSTSSQETLKGIGVIDADSAGALTGIEDLTLVNPSLSAAPGSTLACSGSLGAGSGVTANNDGTYAMLIDFVPDNASTTAGCFQSTTKYLCTRHVVRQKLESDLAAGQYHCIATSASTSTSNVTIDAVSETAHFGAHVIDTESGD